MSEKTKRIIAIVDLVFMLIFTVSLTVYLYNPGLFSGTFGYLALFFGFFGIAVFLVLMAFVRREKKQAEELERLKQLAESGASDGGAETLPAEKDETPAVSEKCGDDNLSEEFEKPSAPEKTASEAPVESSKTKKRK